MDGCIITNRNRQMWMIAIVAVSTFMFTLDYGMLNISLPAISRYFGVGLGIVERLPLTYLLIVTGTLLGFGKLGDVKGFKRVFVLGLCIFALGTFLCGISQGMNMLLAFRVFQCLGEAMFSPTGIALITTCLPHNMKGKALGIVAMAQGLGFCLGPAAGGFINSHFGWRYIFFINIPIGIITAILARKLLPERQPKIHDARFDAIGAAFIFIALSALIFGLNSVIGMGWASRIVLVCFAVSAVSFIIFIAREKKISYPILDLGLFSNRDFTFASGSVFLATFIYMGITFLFPFYLELVMGLDVLQAGLVLMTPAFMMMVMAPFAGKLSDLIGSRKLCSFAMALAALSFVMLAFVGRDSGMPFVILCFLVSGFAMGFFLAPNNKLIMAHAPLDRQGMAAGVYKIVLSTGSVFGIALLPLIFIHAALLRTGGAHIKFAELKKSPDIMMAGFHSIFVAGIFICLLASVFAALARDKVTKDVTR